MTLKPGSLVADRYEVIRLIGEGGMGSVFEAKHKEIEKRVALKILNRELCNSAEIFKRFKQEAKIAGSIGHLNICEVLDFGVTEDGLAFLVMEYLEGESLRSIIEREGRLPVDVSLGIIKQVLDGLEEVHGRGIVHRDLKPENIFITNVKGHGLVVKILDFGISKIRMPGSGSMTMTKTGAMMGTPYYMSPEQMRGSKDVDQRTDIYSCGVILYEMVTGTVPYGGSTFSEVVAHCLEDEFPDPKKVYPDFPADLSNLLRRSMEKDVSKRIESASRFKAEIEKLSPVSTQFKIKGSEIQKTKIGGASAPVPEAVKERWYNRGLVRIVGVAIVLIFVLTGAAFLMIQIKNRNEENINVQQKFVISGVFRFSSRHLFDDSSLIAGKEEKGKILVNPVKEPEKSSKPVSENKKLKEKSNEKKLQDKKESKIKQQEKQEILFPSQIEETKKKKTEKPDFEF